MAENDFALAESVLATIPARADISKQVAIANEHDAKDGLKSAEEEIKAKVDTIVGSDFHFRKLD